MYGNDSMNLEVILSDLDCRGNESSLLNCRVNVHQRDFQVCDHSEDAGVRCGGIMLNCCDYHITINNFFHLQLCVKITMSD